MGLKRLVLLLMCLLVVLFLVVMIYYNFQNRGYLSEPVKMEAAQEELMSDFERTLKWQEKKSKDPEAFQRFQEEMMEKNRDPEYIARLLFAAANQGQEELFTSVFELQQFNRDLFAVENSDKRNVIDGMMKRISRGGSIKEIRVIKEQKTDFNQVTEVEVRLVYQDGEAVNVTLQMIFAGTKHEEHDAIYFVQSSVWDLIQKIEGR